MIKSRGLLQLRSSNTTRKRPSSLLFHQRDQLSLSSLDYCRNGSNLHDGSSRSEEIKAKSLPRPWMTSSSSLLHRRKYTSLTSSIPSQTTILSPLDSSSSWIQHQKRDFWSSMIPKFFNNNEQEDDNDDKRDRKDKITTKNGSKESRNRRRRNSIRSSNIDSSDIDDMDDDIADMDDDVDDDADISNYGNIHDENSIGYRIGKERLVRERLRQPGTMDHESWMAAVNVINWYVRNCTTSNNNDDDDTDENDYDNNDGGSQHHPTYVYKIFLLLDKLVKEPNAKHYLTPDVIGPVMYKWCECLEEREKRNTTTPKGNSNDSEERGRGGSHSSPYHRRRRFGRLHRATTVWNKLDTYQRKYGIQLDTRICHTMIRGFKIAGLSSFPEHDPLFHPKQARGVLDWMIQLSGKGGKDGDNPLIRPSTQTYDYVLSAYNTSMGSRIAKEEAVEHCLELLQQLRSYYTSGWGNDYIPDHGIYKKVLMQMVHIGNGPKAEEILEDLFHLYYVETDELQPQALQPRVSHFTLVLMAYSNYHLLNQNHYDENDNNQQKQRGQQRLQEEDRIDNIYDDDQFEADSIDHKKHEDLVFAAERATLILQRMVELEKISLGTETSLVADADASDSIGTVSSKDGDDEPNEDDDDDEIESLPKLHQFKVFPTNFNIVIQCWSRVRSKEAAFKAAEIYQQLLDLQKIDARSKRPTDHTYHHLIHSWNIHDPEVAEEYFWDWKAKYDLGECVGMPESTRHAAFEKLIFGYYRRGVVIRRGTSTPSTPSTLSLKQQEDIAYAAERCERLFRHVLQQDGSDGQKDLNNLWKPSGVGFSMVMTSWTSKQTVEDTEHAESMLFDLEDYIQRKLKAQESESNKSSSSTWLEKLPIRRTFAMSYMPVIHGWAVLDDPDRAERLLHRFFQVHYSDNSEHLSNPWRNKKDKLDYGTFKKVLNAWLSKATTDPEAPDRAENLVLSMRKYGIRPNRFAFDTVLEIRQIAHENGLAPETSPRVDELLDFLDDLSKDLEGRTTSKTSDGAYNSRSRNKQRQKSANQEHFSNLRHNFARDGQGPRR